MSMEQVQFDAKTEAVIEKVRKLLALADGNDNEHQAEAAANKARELLEAYNLDMAVLGKASGANQNGDRNWFTPRQDNKMRGGLYKWQRDLWNIVAALNFCRYSFYRGLKAGSSYEHRLIGSKANVIGATVMAQYLQDTVERLAKEWVKENRPGQSVFIKEAIAYREGVAHRISTRIWQLREAKLEAERAKQKQEREENARRGVFTENALTLVDIVSTEEDLNMDFLYGNPPGTAAKHRKEREAREQAAQAEADRMLKQQAEWDAAHPEQAAARKAKEKAEYDARMKDYWRKQENARPRKLTAEEERRRLRSFHEGYDKGNEVSLDKQVGQTGVKRLG